MRPTVWFDHDEMAGFAVVAVHANQSKRTGEIASLPLALAEATRSSFIGTAGASAFCVSVVFATRVVTDPR